MGFTESIKPQFASISQPIEEIGSCTAELLLERLENGMDHYEPKSVKLKTSFSMTESVSSLT
jgi:DNA-binding LacI/PurR family transcriptional regulator